MNLIRQEILRKLTHNPIMSFNQLWNKEIPSNKFAYHVEVLVEDNLIEKVNGDYKLTDTGRSLVTYVDGKTGEIVKQPLAVAVIVAKNDDKILLPTQNFLALILLK